MFLEYWIHNRGSNTLDSTYIGLWADPDVGDGFDDLSGCDTTLSLTYAYNANNHDLVYGTSPPAVGWLLIRGPVAAPGDTLGMTSGKTFVNGLDPVGGEEAWNHMAGLLYTGGPLINPQTSQPIRFQYPGDPVAGTGWVDVIVGDQRSLLSSGPFTLAPGDSQRVLAALVVARGSDRLNSITALRSLAVQVRDFASSRHDSITATLATLIRADAAPGRVHIEWRTSAGEHARLWRRPPGGEWEARGELVADGHGVVTLEDRDVVAGARLGYVLGLLQPDGSEVRSGEVWIDVPATLALAIDGLRPNPAAGVPRASFVLEDDSPATLELLDVAGRCVLARDVGPLGAGHHLLPLGTGALRPGLWFLRLTQRGRSVAARAVVVR